MQRHLHDSLAEQVRQVYYTKYNELNHTRYGTANYPLYDGGVDIYGRNHKPVWPKIVKALLARDIDIFDYIGDIFYRHIINRPQDLIRTDIIEDYIERRDSPLVLRKWDAEESAINSQLKFRVALGDSLEQAARTVLLDISSEVSPLVRYVFARKAFPSIDVGETTREAAKQQYLSRRTAYDKFCCERIPEEWRKNG